VSRRSFARAAAATLVLAAALGGCTRFDRAVGSIPWFTVMRDQVAIKPFEQPFRLPPEHSIPTWGREDSLDITTDAGLRVVDALRNPVPRSAESLRRGRLAYDVYCTVCHGAQGRGDGPVAGRLGYAPDLTLDLTRERSDGYLYAIIRHGRGLMPRYGDRIQSRIERWNVVNYVRQLQGM
jgi:mono/diheme cytochrome c family protein